jgi:hypothetical protein
MAYGMIAGDDVVQGLVDACTRWSASLFDSVGGGGGGGSGAGINEECATVGEGLRDDLSLVIVVVVSVVVHPRRDKLNLRLECLA